MKMQLHHRNSFLLFLAVLLVIPSSCSHKTYYTLYRSGQQYTIRNTGHTASAMTQLLAPFRSGLDSQMRAVIVTADRPLSKAQPESTLGNIVADALLYGCRQQGLSVAASVINYSTIGREYIAPGAVSRADLFELVPYDNKIIVAEVNGQALRQICDTIARNNGYPLSGISFVIDSSHKATHIRIGGTAVNDHLVYRIATCSYTARNAPWTTCSRIPVPLSVREALVRYAASLQQQGKYLHSDIENRITYAE